MKILNGLMMALALSACGGGTESSPASVSAPAPATTPRAEPDSGEAIESPMIAIPGGSYTMTRTSRSVSVPAFQMSKYEVTVGQFRQFVAATGYRPQYYGECWNIGAAAHTVEMGKAAWDRSQFAQTEQHPVSCVSWDDAHAYAAWLQTRTGKAYRLPSEAEWEYAARAGSPTRFHFSDAQACRYANLMDATGARGLAPVLRRSLSPSEQFPCDDGAAFATVVGMYEPNAFGLHDMFGNVYEYVEDCEHRSNAGAPLDGSAWTTNCSAPTKVRRGGAFFDQPQHPYVQLSGSDTLGGMDGFRLAISGAVVAPPSAATVAFENALIAARMAERARR